MMGSDAPTTRWRPRSLVNTTRRALCALWCMCEATSGRLQLRGASAFSWSRAPRALAVDNRGHGLLGTRSERLRTTRSEDLSRGAQYQRLPEQEGGERLKAHPRHALSTPHSESPKWTRLLSASWPCSPAPARTHTHPPTPSGAGGGPDTVLEHLRTPGPSPSNMIARVAASAQSRSEKPCVMGVVTDDVDGGG